MTRNEYVSYIEEHYSESAERPFAKDQSIVVFRHSSNRKWFAVVMTIPKNKLEPFADGTVDISVVVRTVADYNYTLGYFADQTKIAVGKTYNFRFSGLVSDAVIVELQITEKES